MFRVSNSSRKRLPSATVSRVAITSEAPDVKGRKSSRPAISKDSVVTASSTSVGRIPGSRRMELKKLTTARCWIWTPLGRPVDPEVKMTGQVVRLCRLTANNALRRIEHDVNAYNFASVDRQR